MRRTFVCLGDSVNLAARLMAKAPPGEIYVDDRVRTDAGDAFIWQTLPDLQVKGKKRRGRRLRPDRIARARLASQDPLRAASSWAVAPSWPGSTSALDQTVAGDGPSSASPPRPGWASRGSSPSSSATPAGVACSWRSGECQSFGTNASYFVWREIWRRLLEIDETDDAEAAARRAWSRRSAAIDPALVAARAAARVRPRPRDPRLGADRAHSTRSCARPRSRICSPTVPPGPRATRAARPRARGLPLDRRALPRPARGAGAVGGRRCRCCSSSPIDRRRRPAAGSGLSGSPHFERAPARPARRRRCRRAHPLEAGAAARGGDAGATPAASRRRSSTTAPRATRSTSRSSSTYLAGAGHRLRDDAALPYARAAGEPAQPRPLPDRRRVPSRRAGR